MAPLPCSYVVPLRRWRIEPLDELVGYLRDLAERCDDVLVVDGSDPEVFAAHARQLPPTIRHLPVGAGRATANGKVGGVLTGVAAARHDRVVLADDDVRYDVASLERMVDELDRAHVVRPQNYFPPPLSWHAWWDTGRTLLNRSVAADYPGTLGVRRSTLLATGGYDGDVLFENLELIRTVTAAGGTVRDATDLYVARHPPTTHHFLGQRVRQAYDSFATPGRLIVELALLPAAVLAVVTGRGRTVLAAALAAVALAERGRRRAGGTAVFPASASLAAPLWLSERAVCSWAAVLTRLRGGVRYAGTRFRRAGTPPRLLRRRFRSHPPLPELGASTAQQVSQVPQVPQVP